MNATCLLCKHFWLSAQIPDYSELTPGSDFEIGCHKRHWSFDPFEETEETMREKMSTAEKCRDYAHHKAS